jgi:protein SCO1/2
METRYQASWLAALAGGLLAVVGSPAGAAAAVAADVAPSLLASLPGDWLDDAGRALDLHALGGQQLVLTMAYASCHRVCPMTIHHLEALQAELDAAGEQATFVVVGFDPQRDDPAAWRAYRRERGLTRSNWLFLTARDDRQVRQFASRLGFEFWRYDEHVMHDERVVVLAPGGALQVSAGPGQILHAHDLRSARERADSKGT